MFTERMPDPSEPAIWNPWTRSSIFHYGGCEPGPHLEVLDQDADCVAEWGMGMHMSDKKKDLLSFHFMLQVA